MLHFHWKYQSYWPLVGKFMHVKNISGSFLPVFPMCWGNEKENPQQEWYELFHWQVTESAYWGLLVIILLISFSSLIHFQFPFPPKISHTLSIISSFFLNHLLHELNHRHQWCLLLVKNMKWHCSSTKINVYNKIEILRCVICLFRFFRML